MGNRVTLYNLTEAVPISYLRLRSLDEAPESLRNILATFEHAQITDTNNTGIPIPWMLYFGLEDFQSAKVPWSGGTSQDLQMPCTSVRQARQRILDARPIFDRLAGDAAIGNEYWREAIELLEGLPFPYLAMDHIEWYCCVSDDPVEDCMAFKLAYSNGAPEDDFLIEWSCYTDNTKPYSHAEWTRWVKRFDRNDVRQMNAIALGYGLSQYDSLDIYEGLGPHSKGPTVLKRHTARRTG